MAAFLRKIRRGEIDRDAACGQRKPRGDQRRTHPLARFRHRLVGKANDMERGQAGRDLHLHVDRAGLDPLKCDGGNPLDHFFLAAPLASVEGSGTQGSAQEHYGNIRNGQARERQVGGSPREPPRLCKAQSTIVIGSGM